MAEFPEDDFLAEFLGDEVMPVPEPEPKEEQPERHSDFGSVQVSGGGKQALIRSMLSQLNEAEIRMEQDQERSRKEIGVHELLADPRNDPETVAIDMFNRQREKNGLIIELLSITRSLKRDAKTLDREIRGERRDTHGKK